MLYQKGAISLARGRPLPSEWKEILVMGSELKVPLDQGLEPLNIILYCLKDARREF